jgi:hypothetical protein
MATYQTKQSANNFWDNLLYHIDPINPIGGFVILAAEPNSAWRADVQNKLLGQGIVADDIDVSISTPTLGQLQSYSSVFIYSDSGYLDAVTLGDNLAAYVDGGGGVVLATFEESVEIQGNWLSGGYEVLSGGGQSSGLQKTLGTVAYPAHPVMTGVSSFNGGTSSYFNTGTLTLNTTVIANWSGDSPLVVEKTGKNGKIILLNFFPPSFDARDDFWLTSTDGALLMSNALKYVAGL